MSVADFAEFYSESKSEEKLFHPTRTRKLLSIPSTNFEEGENEEPKWSYPPVIPSNPESTVDVAQLFICQSKSFLIVYKIV